MRASPVFSLICLFGSVCSQAAPISFPQGFIPFTQLDYETVPDANGYSLVFGEVKTGDAFGNLFHYLQSLPALAGNQQYIGGRTELAPGVFFSNVMIPTTDERFGDFRDFGGAIYDPLTYRPSANPTRFAMTYTLTSGAYSAFPSNIIPESRLFEIFAFRIGPRGAASSAPEPRAFMLIGFGVAALLTSRIIRRSKRQSDPVI